MNEASLPLWKCGLKFISYRIYRPLGSVTSLVEVWIEILYVLEYFGGAVGSLPLWKCGLKSITAITINTGAGHFPCGSVD